MAEATAIILAAGKSTRMNSDLPKVLHGICGRPMLSYALDACVEAGIEPVHVVVGHRQDLVRDAFADRPEIVWVEQSKQRGTGHAVLCCREALEGFEGSVVVIAGDMPLLRRATLSALLESRAETNHVVVLGTSILDDPTGYGRIVRDGEGDLEAIVEERDCSAKQREIREVNPSFYCFEAGPLFESLEKVRPDNAKGEYYITDVIELFRSAGAGVSAYSGVPAEEAMGINSRMDLATVARLMQDRVQLALMESGVTIVDPDNTWIEWGVSIGKDTVVFPFTYIGRNASIGRSCQVGPFAHVARDQRVESGSQVGPTAASQGVAK